MKYKVLREENVPAPPLAINVDTTTTIKAGPVGFPPDTVPFGHDDVLGRDDHGDLLPARLRRQAARRERSHVVERAARMVGVDTDNCPALQHLSGDSIIGPLVETRPGVRVPQAWGAFEAAVYAVTAQYSGPAQARMQVGALVRDLGQPVPGLTHGLTHLFPSAEVVAAADQARFGRSACAKAIHALASGITDGTVVLDGGVALPDLVASLTAIEGIGDSVAQQIALRLGHHDAFPHADPLVREALRTLNAPADVAARWQPWRSMAAVQLITRGAELLNPPIAVR